MLFLLTVSKFEYLMKITKTITDWLECLSQTKIFKTNECTGSSFYSSAFKDVWIVENIGNNFVIISQ